MLCQLLSFVVLVYAFTVHLVVCFCQFDSGFKLRIGLGFF